jgi:endonuclease/exonuclease/phosphatase family metal-dependent hydrolase
MKPTHANPTLARILLCTFLLGLLATTCLFAQATAAPPASQSTTFSLATFNINYAIAQAGASDVQRRTQLDAVVDALKKTEADVVAIQEGNDIIFAHLRKSLDKVYPHMTFYPAIGNRAASGCGWLSKFPLQKTRILPALASAGGMFRTPLATINFQNRSVLLVNVHLCPTVPHGAGLVAWTHALSESEKVHAQEIRYIWTQIEQEQKAAKTDLPVIILGDFNAPTQLNAGTFLHEKSLIDSFAAVTDNPESHPTWRLDHDPAALSFRIDLIWHSPQLTTVSSRIVSSEISDHQAVASKLSFVPQTATASAPTDARPSK